MGKTILTPEQMKLQDAILTRVAELEGINATSPEMKEKIKETIHYLLHSITLSFEIDALLK